MHSNYAWAHWVRPLNYIFFLDFQVQSVLSNLKSLTITANSIVGTLRVADKEVQTDFPVALLEHYVVNNRKRILKLLGFTNATANNPSNKVSFIYYVITCRG